MAKIDKSLYTKEEFRALKEAKRQAKLGNTDTSYAFDRNDDFSQVYILCLKHGRKYSVEYVNTLYNMCKRHCTLDFKFACLTDDPMGLDPNIVVLDLPKGLDGWWCKPYMFSKDLPIKGTILYMDLDVVLSSNIDKLVMYQPNNWCTIRDFTRAMRPKWQKYNSSIVRFRTGQLHFVWDEYIKDPKSVQRRHFGDQDYLYEATAKMRAMLYPDSWIQSWKWEVRTTKEFASANTAKGSRTFKKIENVTPRVECCVCVFHGDPNPHNCEDPWVKENWK
jgi:hypothetical protein|tara:strand:+ start:1108 stop:1938 length:831 start_codon:yes stop_codon:yes gene_type:complete